MNSPLHPILLHLNHNHHVPYRNTIVSQTHEPSIKPRFFRRLLALQILSPSVDIRQSGRLQTAQLKPTSPTTVATATLSSLKPSRHQSSPGSFDAYTRYKSPTLGRHQAERSVTNGTAQTNFTYDSSDRNTAITETNASGSITTTYGRDVQGRLLYRHQDTNGSSASNDYYGYTASGDSPDFITDISGNVTEKYLTLPGDVLVTIRPSRQSAGAVTYSLPNLHGDIFATVDADGKILGTYQTGPFGEKLPIAPTGQVAGQTTTQWNTLNGASLAYVEAT